MTANGHLALELALREGMKVGGEVITTPFTFASTVHAISRVGAKPVFADIDPETLTLDPKSVRDHITAETSAILPVHVYGHPCDVDAFDVLAAETGLKVIYDAAHAFGVRKGGKSLLGAGDVSIVSFHATKLFHTIEGGAIIYHDDSLTADFQAGKNFGIRSEELVDGIGGNAKMNEFQAAMGLAMLGHIDELIAKRKEVSDCYDRLLSSIPGVRCLSPDVRSDIDYNYAYYPVLIDEAEFGLSRDGLYEHLKSKGVFTRRYFWPLACDFDCYSSEHGNDYLPVAREVARKILCLPLYADLERDQAERVCQAIEDIRVGL